jgi:uncharacterized membrane protein
MTQIQSKTPAWLAYLGMWLTGLIFLAIEKNDEDMRWHAAQSLAVFAPVMIIWGILRAIFLFAWLFSLVLGYIIWIGIIALWVLLMYKAYKGERFRVPIAADFAEKYVINWFK